MIYTITSTIQVEAINVEDAVKKASEIQAVIDFIENAIITPYANS